MKNYFTLIAFLVGWLLQAQNFDYQPHTRHRFAQSNMGLEEMLTQTDQSLAQTAIIIGGTHFWGHADFEISIPLNKPNNGFSRGVSTRGKYFPWALKNGGIRPYIGLGWQINSYREEGGSEWRKHQFPWSAGLYYQHNSWLFNIGVEYIRGTEFSYYSDRTSSYQINLNPYSISLGIKYAIDNTISAEKAWQNGTTAKLTDTLTKLHRLNSWTLGIGPSSSFYLNEKENIEYPYLNRHIHANIFADISLGYYWNKPDVQLNLGFRRIVSAQEAYGLSERITRNSILLESYAFLGDYHGFVPFAGLGCSYEMNRLEYSGFRSEVNRNSQFAPVFVAGWDIRPNRLQMFYLRTHIRYSPNLNISNSTGQVFRLDQLEVNFIQLVVLLDRVF